MTQPLVVCKFRPQPEDDAWVQGRSLVATVEDLELLDPDVSAEQLLYRLFHEPGVRAYAFTFG